MTNKRRTSHRRSPPQRGIALALEERILIIAKRWAVLRVVAVEKGVAVAGVDPSAAVVHRLVAAHGRVVPMCDGRDRTFDRLEVRCCLEFKDESDEGDDDGEVDEESKEFVPVEVREDEGLSGGDHRQIADEADTDDEGRGGGKHQKHRKVIRLVWTIGNDFLLFLFRY